MIATAWKRTIHLFCLLVSFCYGLSEMDAKGSGILSQGLCVYRMVEMMALFLITTLRIDTPSF